VILLEGRVSTQIDAADGRVITVGSWAAPSALDKVALLAGRPHTCTAYAVTDCQWRAMSRTDLDELVDDIPAARRHVLHVIATQANVAQNAFAQATTLPTTARLARWLLNEAANTGDVTMWQTQEDIARVLGVTRVTLNRALQRLAKDQLVSVGKRRITLLAPEALLTHTSGHHDRPSAAPDAR
jgi:CRP/FNR family transcriptional regulator, cyclic AMP receptor protein